MDDATRHALATDRTIDITTTGRQSGEPRRIEIWQHQIDGRTYITGLPGRRNWYANVTANPDFTFHLKHTVTADLAATAVPITNHDERLKLFSEAFEEMGRDPSELDDWVQGSPLIEVRFRDAG